MRRARPVVLLLLGALLAGCGLPLERGVRSPGQVGGDARAPGGPGIVLPGPQPDATPTSLVRGFLNAQVSAADDHAVARSFLHPDIRDAWDDDEVLVRTTAQPEVLVDPADESRVVVRTEVLASIAPDGSYAIAPEMPRIDEYVLRRDDAGQLRLAEVPDGVRLSERDVADSFTAQDVYFLRTGRPDAERPRLVPDRLFVPVDADTADVLVRRLLTGPSSALTGAVTTAVPEGTALRRPVSTDDGVLTVDLTAAAAAATTRERQHLSAQLVWTLRGAGVAFTALRLLIDGRPVRVEGAGQVQDRDAWADYEPGRALDAGALLSVRDGRLAGLSGGAVRSQATDGGLPVALGVASPAGGALALLVRPQDEPESVLTGPPTGPFTPVVSGGQTGSLSWGSGDEGLWVVDAGSPEGASPAVLRVRPGRGPAEDVSFTQPPGAGPLTLLRVSRDGARAAAVFGREGARQVYVGRVERSPQGVQLVSFRAVAPTLTDVVDVTWETGTSLIALGALGTATRLPVRLAVDGSVLEPVRTLGLDGEAETVTVAPDRPLVVGARLAGEPVLFVAQDSGLFREPTPGSAPRYPG